MKIKRMAKRLFAVGAGVAMIGATAMGAMAADLSNYPGMFVENGQFNGYFVVGENAASVDNLAMTDIAASMKYMAAGESSTVVLEGDNWLVGTSTQNLEMANNNATTVTGEQVRDIMTFIGEEELGALADGTYKTNEGDYSYAQYLYLDTQNNDQNEIVKYAENDADEVADYFYVKSGANIGMYALEFGSSAQSDVTDADGTADTTGTTLWDFQDTDLNMFGKEYTIVLAKRVTSSGNSAKLTMMGGASKATLLEGEEQTINVKGKDYTVSLGYVDSTHAKFVVNGETTNKLQVGETYKLADGTELGVSEVLYQAYAGGVHSSTFFLGASKMVLQDDDITDSVSDHELVIGSETIDGADVIIEGTDDNTTFKISAIKVNMTADDDFFVSAGGKLSEEIAAVGEEPEILFTSNWDIEYHGLTEETTHDLMIKSSGDRKYELVWFDGDGNQVDMPLAYAASDTTVQLSEDVSDKYLVLTEGESIVKNDYFILTNEGETDGTGRSYLMQYKGADKSSESDPKIKFKNIGSGETLEYSVSTDTNLATIKLGGYTFIVQNATAHTVDDFNITVDLDGAGTISTDTTYIVDKYGAKIALGGSYNGTRAATMTDFTVTISTDNSNDYDNHAPSSVVATIGAAATNEVTFDSLTVGGTASTLISPEGEDSTYYGYTSIGGMIKHEDPTSSPDELTYSYPQTQMVPQVYVTSGATSSTMSSDGVMKAVEVVDATKLDSEVADATAQNLIVVGGPCVNSVAASLMGNPANCAEDFTPGKAVVKLFENGDNMAMLVAGYSGADTRLAGKVIAHRASELSGMEMEISGTTYSDATIGAPTEVVEVVEEVVEEEATME